MLDVLALGLPVGTEFLDLLSPQLLSDLVSWGAIGAGCEAAPPVSARIELALAKTALDNFDMAQLPFVDQPLRVIMGSPVLHAQFFGKGIDAFPWRTRCKQQELPAPFGHAVKILRRFQIPSSAHQAAPGGVVDFRVTVCGDRQASP